MKCKTWDAMREVGVGLEGGTGQRVLGGRHGAAALRCRPRPTPSGCENRMEPVSLERLGCVTGAHGHVAVCKQIQKTVSKI